MTRYTLRYHKVYTDTLWNEKRTSPKTQDIPCKTIQEARALKATASKLEKAIIIDNVTKKEID